MTDQVLVYVVCVPGINMDHIPVRVYRSVEAAQAFAAQRGDCVVKELVLEDK